jgi:hypothetical protein
MQQRSGLHSFLADPDPEFSKNSRFKNNFYSGPIRSKIYLFRNLAESAPSKPALIIHTEEKIDYE